VLGVHALAHHRAVLGQVIAETAHLRDRPAPEAPVRDLFGPARAMDAAQTAAGGQT